MTILVGYPPNKRARSVLRLAAMLGRTSGEDLVVCVVVPARWMPGMSRADAEYQAELERIAAASLEQARADLPAGVTAEFVVHRAKSKPSGLLEVAEQRQASLIVLGSSTAGMMGRVMLSSVADRLLHSSPVPIALATRGYWCEDDAVVTRVTVAYGGSEDADELAAAVGLSVTNDDIAVRLASFAVQLRPPDTAMMSAEVGEIAEEWIADIRASAERVMAAAPGSSGPLVDVVIGRGYDWSQVMGDISWRPGEVLVLGSSSSGPVARVFLGSRATKIIRHSPVPVIVVPRALLKEAATE